MQEFKDWVHIYFKFCGWGVGICLQLQSKMQSKKFEQHFSNHNNNNGKCALTCLQQKIVIRFFDLRVKLWPSRYFNMEWQIRFVILFCIVNFQDWFLSFIATVTLTRKMQKCKKKAITIYRFHGKANRIGENWQVAKLQRHKYKQRERKMRVPRKHNSFARQKLFVLLAICWPIVCLWLTPHNIAFFNVFVNGCFGPFAFAS